MIYVGFREQGLSFEPFGSNGIRGWALGFGVEGLGFRFQGSRLRVQVLWLRVEG
jgi:hypothetical protein